MDKGRRVLDGLNHIGMDGIVQDGHDCTAHTQVFNREGFALQCYAQQHVVDAAAQVFFASGEAENGHYLRCGRDVEAPLGNNSVGFSAQSRNDVAQVAVVHIENAPPQHLFHAETIVLVLVNIVV